MPTQVERWLETFMCKQYAEIFYAYGFKTLHSVCQLQMQQLQSMGIPQEHCELIIQNVQVLRQSTNGPSQSHMSSYRQEEGPGSYGNQAVSCGMSGMTYTGPEESQHHMSRMTMGYQQAMGAPGNPYGNQGNHATQMSMMMASQYPNQYMYSQPQQHHQQQQQQPQPQQQQQQHYSTSYRQRYNSGNGYPPRGPEDVSQPYQELPSNTGPMMAHQQPGSMYGSRAQYPGMAQPANVHQAYPHLRGPTQSPQEVANNILHMASSTYPANKTVQVPISKNRSAPYHVPQRSPHCMQPSGMESIPQQNMGNQGQFMHPNSSPHHQQHQQTRMSPISPASGMMIQSPHSHHSGQSIPSPSPCSLHSPGISSIRSPSSDPGCNMHRAAGVPNPNHHIQSPQHRSPYHMSSPVNTPHQRMVSPVPVSQQLQVSVPSSQHCYPHDSISSISPAGQHQYMSGNSFPSPSSQSGQHSNISSPYTPGSKHSVHSPMSSHFTSPPLQPHQHPNPGSVHPNKHNTKSSIASLSDPLQSLQKLCMLPERQVIDPKSVVNDACTPSPQNDELSKNFEADADSQGSDFGTHGRSSESASSGTLSQCQDGQHGSLSTNRTSSITESSNQNTNTCGNVTNSSELHYGQEKTEKQTLTADMSSSNHEQSEQKAATSLTTVTTQASSYHKPDNVGEQKEEEKVQCVQNLPQEPVTSTDKCDGDEVICQPKKAILLRATKEEKTLDTESETEIVTNKCEGTTFKESNKGKVRNSVNDLCDENEKEQLESYVFEKENEEDSNSAIVEEDKKRPANGSAVVNGTACDGDVHPITDESDSDSQLIVRKDIKTTYLKQDRFKCVETGRVRGHSTGSLSDEHSELEYEDHIGCDDIVNDLSFIDDKLDNEISDIKESSEVSNVTDKVVISSPHWKKSKLNTLQTVPHNESIVGERKHEAVRRSRRRSGPRNVHLNGMHDTVVIDLDDESVPSPMGTDVDHGNSTMTRTARPLHRQRKTPLKYNDTSFFQGDFVFVEEEDDQEFFEAKHKPLKQHTAIDVNHNTKCNNDLRKKDKGNHIKNETLKDKKQKQNVNTKSKYKNESGDVNGAEIDRCVSRGEAEEISQDKLSDGNESKGSRIVSQKKNSRVKSEQCSGNNSLSNKSAKSDQMSRRNSRTPSKSKDFVPSDSDSSAPGQNTPQSSTRKRSNSTKKTGKDLPDPKHKNGVVNNKKDIGHRDDEKKTRKQDIDKDVKPSKERLDESLAADVIVIDDPCDNGRETCVNGADKMSKVNVKSESKPLVKVELPNSVLDHISEDVKPDTKHIVPKCKQEDKLPVHKKRTPNNPVSKRSSSSDLKANKVTKNKVPSNKKRNRHLDDDDDDWELEPKKKCLKSVKPQKPQETEIIKSSHKKKDKWADFKGPTVRLEGDKENPEKCVVLNEPVDTSGLKSRSLHQTVSTTIHISHLPSEKSVLIPEGEPEEGTKWSCALCGKHSSYKFLGDLFGPYTVESMMDETTESPPKLQKKRRSDDSAQPGTSKQQQSRTSKRVWTSTKEATMWREVWVHESCAVWSDGVFLIGSKIYGLQEAVKIASQTPCTHCHEMGAMLGCLYKGCQQKFHHACSLETECYLDEENFSLLCPKHKVRKLKQLEDAAAAAAAASTSAADV